MWLRESTWDTFRVLNWKRKTFLIDKPQHQKLFQHNKNKSYIEQENQWIDKNYIQIKWNEVI